MGIVTTTGELERKAAEIVDAILGEMTDRSGLQEAWESLDESTRAETREAWVEAAVGVLETIGKATP